MPELPTDWSALCAIVFLLGMRHGFDADHLAAVDGLTRLSARSQRGYARYCGALFSLGHGGVVMAIATGVGLARQRWAPPLWLDALGAWISIGFLVLLGVLNLRAVLAAVPGSVVAMVGLKGAFVGRLMQARSPWGVAAVGGLFALSFDTVSQSALFAATATQFGGVLHAVALGALFVGGMLATDGLNGWWMSRLIVRTDRMAALASRTMSLAVAGVSLLVAAFGMARLLAPSLAGWAGAQELVPGLVVVGVMASSYGLASWLARRPPALRRVT